VGETSSITPRTVIFGAKAAPGYRVELVAAEPLVMDPVAFDWGPDGRLWVAEMRDYPNGLTWNRPGDPLNEPGGRIKVLTDTDGAAYDPLLDTHAITHHLYKGQGKPDYSLFQGVTESGETAAQLLASHGITDVDVTGIATDHCVRASALDALHAGVRVRVLSGLVAGVAPESSAAALAELAEAGAEIVG